MDDVRDEEVAEASATSAADKELSDSAQPALLGAAQRVDLAVVRQHDDVILALKEKAIFPLKKNCNASVYKGGPQLQRSLVGDHAALLVTPNAQLF